MPTTLCAVNWYSRRQQGCARDLFSRDRDDTWDANVRDWDKTETLGTVLGTVTETRPRRYKLPRRCRDVWWKAVSSPHKLQPTEIIEVVSGLSMSHYNMGFLWSGWCCGRPTVCDTCLCLVLACCWCCTAASGSDLDSLLFNNLSLTCVCHCDVVSLYIT